MYGPVSKFEIRAYSTADRMECQRVFQSNVPRFFREHELPEFLEFIDRGDCQYLVIRIEDRVIGCGGYGVRLGSEVADLCWGMVDADFHGRGAGEALLWERLSRIASETSIRAVRLGTSQWTQGFFQRAGFSIQSSKVDGYALGIDEVEMRLELTAETRELIARRAG